MPATAQAWIRGVVGKQLRNLTPSCFRIVAMASTILMGFLHTYADHNGHRPQRNSSNGLAAAKNHTAIIDDGVPGVET
jgi:hypothetical protein